MLRQGPKRFPVTAPPLRVSSGHAWGNDRDDRQTESRLRTGAAPRPGDALGRVLQLHPGGRGDHPADYLHRRAHLDRWRIASRGDAAARVEAATRWRHLAEISVSGLLEQ